MLPLLLSIENSDIKSINFHPNYFDHRCLSVCLFVSYFLATILHELPSNFTTMSVYVCNRNVGILLMTRSKVTWYISRSKIEIVLAPNYSTTESRYIGPSSFLLAKHMLSAFCAIHRTKLLSNPTSVTHISQINMAHQLLRRWFCSPTL